MRSSDRKATLVDREMASDGGKLRVPLNMRDGMTPVQRAVTDDKAARQFDESQARHRPGPIYIRRSRARAQGGSLPADVRRTC